MRSMDQSDPAKRRVLSSVDGAGAAEPLEVFARRVLPVYAEALARDDFWEDGSAARIHEVGTRWARVGRPLDMLLDTVHVLAGDLLDSALHDHSDLRTRCTVLRRFSDVCGRVAIELLQGYNSAAVHDEESRQIPLTPRDRAVAMMAGEAAVLEVDGRPIAPAYGVVAVRTEGIVPQAVESAFVRYGGPGVLPLVRADGGYVLLPAECEEDAVRTCERVAAAVAGQIWAAVVWTPSASVPDGGAVVDDVLALVSALKMPSGVYRRHDVLVEFAAVRTPATARIFRKLIEPVMESDVLRETLEALIAEDGNRTRAAEKLIIHRSTIDYRLLRIEHLTGYSPSSVRGLRTLTAAYAVHTLANRVPARGDIVDDRLRATIPWGAA